MADEREIKAATEAILACNSDPGPKLTHYMARRRARAALDATHSQMAEKDRRIEELQEALDDLDAHYRAQYTAASQVTDRQVDELREALAYANGMLARLEACVTSDKLATNSGAEAVAHAIDNAIHPADPWAIDPHDAPQPMTVSEVAIAALDAYREHESSRRGNRVGAKRTTMFQSDGRRAHWADVRTPDHPGGCREASDDQGIRAE